MINIHITKNSISVQGHAETGAPPGMNIVCAAVSALTQTMVIGLIDVAECEIGSIEESGNVQVTWTKLNKAGKTIIDTWLLGVAAIQREYGHIAFI